MPSNSFSQGTYIFHVSSPGLPPSATALCSFLQTQSLPILPNLNLCVLFLPPDSIPPNLNLCLPFLPPDSIPPTLFCVFPFSHQTSPQPYSVSSLSPTRLYPPNLILCLPFLPPDSIPPTLFCVSHQTPSPQTSFQVSLSPVSHLIPSVFRFLF